LSAFECQEEIIITGLFIEPGNREDPFYKSLVQEPEYSFLKLINGDQPLAVFDYLPQIGTLPLFRP